MSTYEELTRLTRQRLALFGEDSLRAAGVVAELENLVEVYGAIAINEIKFMACYETLKEAEQKAKAENQLPK